MIRSRKPPTAVVLAVYGSVAISSWVIAQTTIVRQRNDAGWVGVIAMTPTLLVCVLMWARAPRNVMTKLVTIYLLSTVTPMLIEAIYRWSLWRSQSPIADDLSLEKVGIFGVFLGLPTWAGTLPMLPLMMVVFPDGIPKSGLWRKIFYAQIISVLLMIPVLLDQNKEPILPIFQAVGVATGFVIFGSAILRTFSLARMWIRGDSATRYRLRAFVFAAATVIGCYFPLGFATEIFPQEVSNWVNDVLIFSIISTAIPVGLGLGILRDRLYGIEVFISRALVAASMTLMIFGIYLTATGLIAVTTGTSNGMSWVALSGVALSVAILTPLYRFVKTAVDRVLYGDRESPEILAHRIMTSFQTDIPGEEISETIVRTLRESLKFPFVELQRKSFGDSLESHISGYDIGTSKSEFNLVWSGKLLATLTVGARNGEKSITPVDREILKSLLPVISTALFVSQATDEVIESRERLVKQVVEERARLRRALHDSISPTLAGISLAAATATSLSREDPRFATLLKNIEEGSSSGTKVLEALLSELRPPGLAELGLYGAIDSLSQQLQSSTEIIFQTDEWNENPLLDPKNEEVAYLCIAESLMNVARHSHATTCTLEVRSDEEKVIFQISDDGIGVGEGVKFGHGLESASTRVAQRGGSFVIRENDPRGCSVFIELPKLRIES